MLNEEFNNLINEMEINILNYRDIELYYYELIKLYNLNKNSEFEDILNLIKFEIDALCFKIQDYTLIPIYQEYPNINEFTQNHVDYIKSRHDSTQNYLLKSFYSWILYKKINNKDALKYLRSYIDSLRELSRYLKENNQDHLMIAKCLTNAYFQVNSYVYGNHEEIKDEIINFIFDEDITDNSTKKHLIKFMTKSRKSKNFDLDDVDKLCWDIANEESNPHQAIEFLKMGSEIDKDNNYDWNSKIASNYEKLMDLFDDVNIKFI